jgi:hypothetical protein
VEEAPSEGGEGKQEVDGEDKEDCREGEMPSRDVEAGVATTCEAVGAGRGVTPAVEGCAVASRLLREGRMGSTLSLHSSLRR